MVAPNIITSTFRHLHYIKPENWAGVEERVGKLELNRGKGKGSVKEIQISQRNGSKM